MTKKQEMTLQRFIDRIHELDNNEQLITFRPASKAAAIYEIETTVAIYRVEISEVGYDVLNMTWK